MLTYRFPAGGLARVLRLLGAVVLTASSLSTAEAQDRKYLFEIGAGGGYQAFGDSATTNLTGALGGIGRIGVWLPYNFSLEAEGWIGTPKTKSTDDAVKVRMGLGALLYNLPLGSRTWGYGKLGFGQGSYKEAPDCPRTPQALCGSTRMLVVGLGFRVAITPQLLARVETAVYPNNGSAPIDSVTTVDVKFTNYGLNVGLSYMLGSKPLPDQDRDGVPNNRDRCTDTPAGAQVDGSGCPQDNDADGVANGLDRCPNTAVGATIDASGCPRDTDNDNIADGVDKCPDTPEGVLVDATGCPKDSDGDSIADGLDRCSDTPKGATVDALGCPGDEDSDGVLDGLDRCPRTAIGATVNASGCASQQRSGAAAPLGAGAAAAPRPAPQRVPDISPVEGGGTGMVLAGVTFESGSARLQSGSYVELDSIAKVLLSNPNTRVEISGHTDDAGVPADNMRISSLRAEAVRNYLVAKGVPFQQMVARGYGSSMPRTPDTTPRGRAINRRVEIRPLPPE
jgi:outer membrane protein OmpA-like peptidoglycan-associated protein